MKNIVLFLAAIALIASSCNSTSGSETMGLRLNTDGDFESSASALRAVFKAVTTATCDTLGDNPETDDPSIADGEDCDGDGGAVAHITPSEYSIAFKRISLVPADEDSEQIDLIADTGTLAASEVVSFTEDSSSVSVVTIDPADLVAGNYSGVEAEMYYFQLTFPVNGTDRIVRMYMSDDDFEAEGSLGHHQGDITFIDDDGTELGWIDSNWNEVLANERGEAQNGAGGTDEETGHDRGFFGDEGLWNSEDFMQGADQDIYITTMDFDDALAIPDPSTITDLTTITVVFSVADTFFFEDFGTQDGNFNPEQDDEASVENAEWAPLVPTATVSVVAE